MLPHTAVMAGQAHRYSLQSSSQMADGYHRVPNAFCEGTPHVVDGEPTFLACVQACRAASCKCVQFRSTAAMADAVAASSTGSCRWIGGDFEGTRTSKAGWQAWVREGATIMVLLPPPPPPPLPRPCIPIVPVRSSLSTRLRFYVQTPVDEHALLACYAAQRHRAFPADPVHQQHSLLLAHPARTNAPGEASLYYVAFPSWLSRAAGTCAGATHYQRVEAVTRTLAASHFFQLRPSRHFVLNAGPDEGTADGVLGALGGLVARRGGHSVCFGQRWSCGSAFESKHHFVVMPPPAVGRLSSIGAAVERTGGAPEPHGACGARQQLPSARRDVMLFYRGGLGHTTETQTLRIRLPLLRSIPGAQISIVGVDPRAGKGRLKGEHLLAYPQWLAKKLGAKIVYVSRLDDDRYIRMLLRSTFCVCPVGDQGGPGGRLWEAIAAGCVPIVVGLSNGTELPLAHQLPYTRFAAFLSRTAFAKDPVFAVSALLHKLTPKLPAMRLALGDARQLVLHHAGGRSSALTTMLLQEVGRTMGVV